MNKGLPHQQTELDAREQQLRLSPAVQDAFRTIAVAAKHSEHFDGDIYEIVKDFSNGKTITVRDFIISMPHIAEEVRNHLSANKDPRVEEAWSDLATQLAETGGFSVSQSRARKR